MNAVLYQKILAHVKMMCALSKGFPFKSVIAETAGTRQYSNLYQRKQVKMWAKDQAVGQTQYSILMLSTTNKKDLAVR